MAPEVLCDREPYDPYKADTWSLGVIIFSMIHTGETPYKTEDQYIQCQEQKRNRWRDRRRKDLS